jgi:hypothetical protein
MLDYPVFAWVSPNLPKLVTPRMPESDMKRRFSPDISGCLCRNGNNPVGTGERPKPNYPCAPGMRNGTVSRAMANFGMKLAETA